MSTSLKTTPTNHTPANHTPASQAPAKHAPTAKSQPLDHRNIPDYRNMQADDRIVVEANNRLVLVAAVQATVVELLDLFLTAKQAHWNIRGPLFLPLHENLQSCADTYRQHADVLAERILQVGFAADGRPSTVVATADLGEVPAGFLPDRYVLELMTSRLTEVGQRVRRRIQELHSIDGVTADKLQDLSHELDKQLWQFHAQLQ